MNIALIILTILGIVTALSAVCAYIIQRKENQRLLEESNRLRTQIDEGNEARNSAELEIRKLITQQTEITAELAAEKAKHEAEISALREKNEEQRERERQEREQLEETLRLQFRNLANEILGEQTQKVHERNKESLDMLLKPFKENITDFRSRIEEIYTAQTKQSGAMQTEIKNLMDLNHQISVETTNLTNALKGNSKVQGDWGEMILETILDSSSLIKGVHYDVQYNVKDEQGHNLRPDVVLHLPENHDIVIDSKVSLTAYLSLIAAEDDATRTKYLAAHIASVRQHVVELSDKEYQQYFNSPDFVIMFMPNESAFITAMQKEPTLWNDAYKSKVIISSSTNLFALLKLVGDLWKRHDQERNVQEIAACGQRLYEQAAACLTSLEGVGTSLKKAQEAFEDARKRLCTGKENIIRLGEKMRKKARFEPKRTFPKNLVEMSEESTILIPDNSTDEESENE